jgi:polyferredoxin
MIQRPWCRVSCPPDGWLALFNRWSLFHLRFRVSAYVTCRLCRRRRLISVKVDERVNVTGCIRCLDGPTSGAI